MKLHIELQTICDIRNCVGINEFLAKELLGIIQTAYSQGMLVVVFP